MPMIQLPAIQPKTSWFPILFIAFSFQLLLIAHTFDANLWRSITRVAGIVNNLPKKVSSFHDSSENESDVSCYLWITRVIEAEAIDWIKATETMVMVINTGDVSKATLVEGLITFDIA